MPLSALEFRSENTASAATMVTSPSCKLTSESVHARQQYDATAVKWNILGQWLPTGYSTYVQVTLKLLTDIEPGTASTLSTLEDAGDTCSSGAGWEYTGNNSLLKSALQKNVRLGRADAAVRYPRFSNRLKDCWYLGAVLSQCVFAYVLQLHWSV